MKNLRMFALLVVVLMLGCHRQPRSHEPTAAAVAVRTVPVQLEQIPETYEAIGTIRPKAAAEVSAKVMAVVRRVAVGVGDAVAAGQVLAELDDRELRAEFDRAKADFDRFSALLVKQAATPAEFDAVQARFRLAETALSHATLTAPFSGVVAQKLCDPGDMAVPGQPLFVIEQAETWRLETQIPDRLAGRVGVGQSWQVTVDATGETCTGKVTEVVPAADPNSRSVTVKADLSCRQPLKSGLFARAAVPVGQRPALLLPADAVRTRGQLTYVFVAQEGRAQMRLVKTGKQRGEQVEVLSGVQAGEPVIVAGEVADGTPIAP